MIPARGRASMPTPSAAAQVGGKNGEYIKPSTTAKQMKDKHGRMILSDVADPIRTSHNA